MQGEKKREQEGGGAAGSSSGSAPERNEIVACTICATDGSPCTHTASNNGCATEVSSCKLILFQTLFSQSTSHNPEQQMSTCAFTFIVFIITKYRRELMKFSQHSFSN